MGSLLTRSVREVAEDGGDERPKIAVTTDSPRIAACATEFGAIAKEPESIPWSRLDSAIGNSGGSAMSSLAKPFEASFFVGLLFVLASLAVAGLAIGGRALPLVGTGRGALSRSRSSA